MEVRRGSLASGRSFFGGAQFEAGRDPFLERLWKAEECAKPRRWLAFPAPKFRPLNQTRLGDLTSFSRCEVTFLHGVEQTRGEKSQHETGREISAYLAGLDFEFAEPFAHSVLGRVVIMMWRFV